MAIVPTSHPDFEDTPLWNENGDGNYTNDGLVWHAHWVVLIKDSRVAGGFSVKEFDYMGAAPKLPSTSAPGMHMYMDSPGFTVTVQGNTGRVVVPLDRILAARAPAPSSTCQACSKVLVRRREVEQPRVVGAAALVPGVLTR